jgi:hypothetical protein
MSHLSYVSSYFHCVFSTKERRPLITPPLRERLWPFAGGFARQNGMKAITPHGLRQSLFVGANISRPFGTCAPLNSRPQR